MDYFRSYCHQPEIRVNKGDNGTTVEWYAAVFDSLSEDLGGFREKVGRRAFSGTLHEADVRALLNHNPDVVLGRNKAGTLKLHVDHVGLRSTVEMPPTNWAHDLAVSIERGDITAGSFGFRVMDDKWTPDDEHGYVRELREVQLFDVSLVTYPAYPGTDGSASLRALDDARARGVLPEPPREEEAPVGGHGIAIAQRRRRLVLMERRA